MNNPIQPLIKDDKGTLRFKENKIVSYLLKNGGINLNNRIFVNIYGKGDFHV